MQCRERRPAPIKALQAGQSHGPEGRKRRAGGHRRRRGRRRRCSCHKARAGRTPCVPLLQPTQALPGVFAARRTDATRGPGLDPRACKPETPACTPIDATVHKLGDMNTQRLLLLLLLALAAVTQPGAEASQPLPAIRLRTRTLRLDADSRCAPVPQGRHPTVAAAKRCDRTRVAAAAAACRARPVGKLLGALLCCPPPPAASTRGGCRPMRQRRSPTPPTSGGARCAAGSSSCSPTGRAWRRGSGRS